MANDDSTGGKVRSRRALFLVLPLLIGAVGTAALWADDGPADEPPNRGLVVDEAPEQEPEELPRPSGLAFEPEPPRAGDLPAGVRWIAVGGGAEPSSSQVSLEQDLRLAAETFGDRGVTLFAGGPGAAGVQVLDRARTARTLTERLGELFDPRANRDTSYRAPRIGDRAATLPAIESVLDDALADGDGPLLFYFAGHGEPGDAPRDNVVRVWGGWGLSAADLAGRLDRSGSNRRVRVVVAACFAGGFAELAFAAADPEEGPAPTPRCGLFASTWDSESSGCDPDPRRSEQEGYSLHFLNALQGMDRDGAAADGIDLDGDGTIGLLEAHTRVRIASRSIDVPTTTSERWLRHAAPTRGPEEDVELPEEEAVIDRLGAELDLADRDAALTGLAEVEEELAELDERLAALEDEADAAYTDLRIGLLERWPALDDPYHPAYRPTLSAYADVIAAWLDESEPATVYEEARAAVDAAAERYDRRRADAARVLRLARAHDTRLLARRLAARGGASWDTYQQLLACERAPID